MCDYFRTLDYREGPCPSVLKMDHVSWIRFIRMRSPVDHERWTFRSRGQENSAFSSRWSANSIVSLPIGFEKFAGAKADRWYYMGLMLSSRHSVCIRESASPALCHSQGYGKLAWRSRVYAINFMASQGCWRPRLLDNHKPPNQATPVTDPVACLLGTFPNNNIIDKNLKKYI